MSRMSVAQSKMYRKVNACANLTVWEKLDVRNSNCFGKKTVKPTFVTLKLSGKTHQRCLNLCQHSYNDSSHQSHHPSSKLVSPPVCVATPCRHSCHRSSIFLRNFWKIFSRKIVFFGVFINSSWSPPCLFWCSRFGATLTSHDRAQSPLTPCLHRLAHLRPQGSFCWLEQNPASTKKMRVAKLSERFIFGVSFSTGGGGGWQAR
jgi:hypothetical protein